MQRIFVSNLLLLLFLNLLIKPIWIFGIDLTVQNRLGADVYGLYFAIFNFSMLFNILLDLGLTHYNNQAVARNKVEVVRNFSNLTSLKFLLGVLYMLITLVFGHIMGYRSLGFHLLTILSVNQFLASLILFLRSNLSGMHFFKTDSFLSILDKSLMILICGSLLFVPAWKDSFDITTFAYSQSASYLITAIVAFTLALRKARIFRLRVDVKSYLSGLKKSLPYALLILLMALYTRVDGIMLERLKGSYESGVYAAAFRLLDSVNQIGYLFAVLLLPLFSGMIAKKQDMSNLVKLAFSMILVGTVSVALPSMGHSEQIMSFLYSNDAELSTPVFRLLITSSVAFGITYVFGTLLTANQNLKLLNVTALSGFVLNIILNFLLIPSYGAEGAAFATVITQFLTALVQMYLSYRVLQLDSNSGFWLRLVAFLSMAIVSTYLLSNFELSSWFVFYILHIGFLLVLSFLLKLFNIRAAIELFKARFR